jgi:hypothetical protein
MQGTCDVGVYSTPMSQQPTCPRMNTDSIIGTASLAMTAKSYEVKTVDALINYYHMTLGSPTINEWINCINKFWIKPWYGLTADRVRKYCTKKEQTAFGNHRMISKNVKSPNNNYLYDESYMILVHSSSGMTILKLHHYGYAWSMPIDIRTRPQVYYGIL